MIRDLLSDRRGVVSVEFAVAGAFMMTATLNAIDVGGYIYQAMQVENAAQMAAQAALRACTTTELPVTTNCPAFGDAAAAAVASTTLGKRVVLASDMPVEAYYCVDGKARLQQVGTPGKKPSTCADAGDPAVPPGDYLAVSVSFDYKPLLKGAGVAALLETPIRRSALVRVG
jgi:Flp pilus assembly protein TadG